jgi:two-component system sensor kinase FixL
VDAYRWSQLHEHAHLSTMATAGETAGAMAHELNQPLAAILSNAQALRHLLLAPAPPAREDTEPILQDIIDAARRAADVIARVRRLIRNETFEMVPIDVNTVAHDVVHIVTHSPGAGAIRLDEQLAAGGSVVPGDRVQLQQVLLNLLQNAVQAVSAHRLSGGWVAIVTRPLPSAIEVVVSDNGPGIPASALGRVFDAFYTTKREGLGLGLSISRSIVELHGGTLTAANRAGGGAEFTVSLPTAHRTG